MSLLRIIKLGGSTLATPEQVKAMAQTIAQMRRPHEQILVVVSAMGKTTDHLYDSFVRAAGDCANALDLENFISQGEWSSAQLLTAALKSTGQNAVAVTPWNPDWPLIVDIQNHSAPLQEKINEIRNFKLLPYSKKKIKQTIGAYLESGRIVVICGFVARNSNGQITTLGRGGSDISAFLLADTLKADEIILVKDVDGVLPWDPSMAQVHPQAQVSLLEAKDLYLLSSAGSRVVHPGALRYLKKGKKARVVSFKSNDWTQGGTEILRTKTAALRSLNVPLAAITFIGEHLASTAGVLHQITRTLKNFSIPIYSITVSESFLAVYINELSCSKAYSALTNALKHTPQVKSSAVKKGLVKITLTSAQTIEAPGAIEWLMRPLAKANINIWEIVTVHSDIMFFVESPLASKAAALIKKALRKKS